MTVEDDTRSEGSIVEIGQELSCDFVESYWGLTTRTLIEVFGQDARVASRRVDGLRGRIEHGPKRPSPGSVYHIDPFQVAADLAGVEIVSAEQERRYKDITWRLEAWQPVNAA